MYQFPIGMEMFSAANEEQWKVIRETIDSSDYYILIIGHRYGSVIEKGKYAGISYTQKEFQYALSRKIPILAFLIHDNALITPDRMEDDPVKKKKLEEFKGRVKKAEWLNGGQVRRIWQAKWSVVLIKQISRGKRPGWIRTDAIDFAGTQKELVEMSKKIRELSKENDELKKNVRIRMPKFSIEINDGKEISIPYQDIDLSRTKEFYLDILDKEEEQYIRNIQDPEQADTSMFVPNEEGLKEYQKNYEMNENRKKNKISFQILCKNIGTGKANDINLEIKIPKNILES